MIENEEEIKTAVLQYGEKAKMYIDLILKDADKFIHDIEQGLSNDNAEDVGLAAHSLKSIMKQLQAHEIAELAFKIEQSGKNEELLGVNKTFEQLEGIYKEIKNYLATLLDEGNL